MLHLFDNLASVCLIVTSKRFIARLISDRKRQIITHIRASSVNRVVIVSVENFSSKSTHTFAIGFVPRSPEQSANRELSQVSARVTDSHVRITLSVQFACIIDASQSISVLCSRHRTLVARVHSRAVTVHAKHTASKCSKPNAQSRRQINA